MIRLTEAALSDLWPHIRRILQPAFDKDPIYEEAHLLARVRDESASLWVFPEGAMILSIGASGQDRPIWVEYAAGVLPAGLQSKRAAVSRLMASVETLGRQNRCTEIRIEQRLGWKALLPDFTAEAIQGIPVLRRSITHG